ncbi:MAG: zinc ribbon domain-containing protein [Sphingomicrobium sp.]
MTLLPPALAQESRDGGAVRPYGAMLATARGNRGDAQVLCPECGAKVDPLREFCPKCGTPTDPGLRERRPGARRSEDRGTGDRSPDELKRNRNRVMAFGAGLLILLGVTGKLNWPWPDVPIKINAHEEPRGPVSIDAEQLYQVYRDDPEGAARRFAGREMEVTGEFVRIVPDGYGSIDLRLKTSNPESQIGVDLAGVAIEPATALKPGQRVTVSCQGIAGGGNDRWLRNCAIQGKGDDGDERASVPAPPPIAPPPPPVVRTPGETEPQ